MEGNIESASIRHGAGIPDAMREFVVGAAGGIAQVLIGRSAIKPGKSRMYILKRADV